MLNQNLLQGLLSQLLIFDETGCRHAAENAVRLLDMLCESSELDQQLRHLCERAQQRLVQRWEQNHARAA